MGNFKQILPVSNTWITHSATNLTNYPLIPGSTIIAHGAGLAPPMIVQYYPSQPITGLYSDHVITQNQSEEPCSFEIYPCC